MTLPEVVLLIFWGIFLFYWTINWKNVKPTKERRFSIVSLRGGIFLILALLLIDRFTLHNSLHLPACQWTWVGCNFLAHSSPTQSIFAGTVSVLLGAAGLTVAVLARRTLGRNWSSGLDVKQGHELVTRGVYAYIRHPIYAGLLLLLLATLIQYRSVLEVFICIIVFVVILFRLTAEERLMTHTFPKEYPQYMKQTKRLIPFIW